MARQLQLCRELKTTGGILYAYYFNLQTRLLDMPFFKYSFYILRVHRTILSDGTRLCIFFQ